VPETGISNVILTTGHKVNALHSSMGLSNAMAKQNNLNSDLELLIKAQMSRRVCTVVIMMSVTNIILSLVMPTANISFTMSTGTPMHLGMVNTIIAIQAWSHCHLNLHTYLGILWAAVQIQTRYCGLIICHV